MAREILFRGKRIDNGEWVEGDYNSCVNVIEDTIFWINDDLNTSFAYVEPITVGQYTGLDDCNGNQIFEGDIVKLSDKNCSTHWEAVVVFGNPYGKHTWGWEFLYIGEKPDVNTDILLWAEIDEGGISCEVIGNIYGNPELLKDIDNPASN